MGQPQSVLSQEEIRLGQISSTCLWVSSELCQLADGDSEDERRLAHAFDNCYHRLHRERRLLEPPCSIICGCTAFAYCHAGRQRQGQGEVSELPPQAEMPAELKSKLTSQCYS